MVRIFFLSFTFLILVVAHASAQEATPAATTAATITPTTASTVTATSTPQPSATSAAQTIAPSPTAVTTPKPSTAATKAPTAKPTVGATRTTSSSPTSSPTPSIVATRSPEPTFLPMEIGNGSMNGTSSIDTSGSIAPTNGPGIVSHILVALTGILLAFVGYFLSGKRIAFIERYVGRFRKDNGASGPRAIRPRQ